MPSSSEIDASLQHGLLLPLTPPYSDVTLRRAFIVWSTCGQLLYQATCNYYHCLEDMESKMTTAQRASSLHQDLSLFVNQPPKSVFLNDYFPLLYKKRTTDRDIAEKLSNYVHNIPVFQVKGFHNIAGVHLLNEKKKELLEDTVRKFCAERQKTLPKFLNEFKKYIQYCKLQFHVLILIRYMLNKNIGSDLILYKNIPKDFDFLHDIDTEFNNIKTKVMINNNDKYKINNIKFDQILKKIKYDSKNFDKINNDELNLSEKFENNLNKNNGALKHNLSLDRDDYKKDFNTKLNQTDVETKIVNKQRKSRNVVVLNTSNDSVKSFFEYHHNQIKLTENFKPKCYDNETTNGINNDKYKLNESFNGINETPIDYKEFVQTIADLNIKVNISSEDHYIFNDHNYINVVKGKSDKSISILNSSMIEDHFDENCR